METRTALKTVKENERRGYDSKIAITGTAIKRKKLSDITNTVSSSSTDPQFQESSMRGGCVITKECVAQLMEENAAFLKAITEKNKILELSGIELQKLRLTIERYTQQIRLLAQANTQIQAELTVSKEKNKTLQHELGCTALLLKFKNSELEEKENLIQVLNEKLRLVEEKLIEQLDECRSMEIEQLKHVELTKGDLSCLSSRKRPCRSKRSIASTIQPKQKPSSEWHNKETDRLNESDEMKATEDGIYESDQVACCTSRSNAVDGTMSHKLSKHGRRGKSLSETGTAIKQGETTETHAKRKYSKRRSDMTSKAWKYEDPFPHSEFLANSVTNGPLNETALKGENGTRKSRRKGSEGTEYETQEYEENFTETMGANIENCEPIIESTGEVQSTRGGSASSFEEGQGVKRTSVGRPLRKAAEKISSYKEIPLNVKMRRIENREPIIESIGEVQSTQGGSASSFEEGQGVKRTSVGRPLRKAAEKISSYKEIPLNVKMRRS